MSALGLGLGLSLGGRRVGDAGNMPAKFTIAAGSVDDGIKRINFSETITVTITGDVTADFGDGQGELTAGTHTVSDALDYWTLKITGGTGGGTITFGKRKQITYLYLAYLNSLVITGDITGMKLTTLYLRSLGSSVITGDITGMKLTYLLLYDLGSSTITGDITGMKLTYLYLRDIGSSLTYGTNLLNITDALGIQLLGDTVFATAEEYERLIIDAAAATWSHATTRPFRIDAGTKDTDPGWENIKSHIAVLLDKASSIIIPSAWLSANGGSWPSTWNEYEG